MISIGTSSLSFILLGESEDYWPVHEIESPHSSIGIWRNLFPIRVSLETSGYGRCFVDPLSWPITLAADAIEFLQGRRMHASGWREFRLQSCLALTQSLADRGVRCPITAMRLSVDGGYGIQSLYTTSGVARPALLMQEWGLACRVLKSSNDRAEMFLVKLQSLWFG